jgi:photosystem II stability/assembly factor-like uncharacterized protein
MYRSTNGGVTWSSGRPVFSRPGGGCYYITSVSIAPYDATSSGSRSRTDGHFTGWRRYLANHIVRSSAFQHAAPFARSVRASCTPHSAVTAYPRCGSPSDYGRNWTDINGNLPDIPTYDVIELDGNIIIGTELGAFISEDEGSTWQRLGTGMPSLCVQRLMYQPETGVLRAITHGRGMYDTQWAHVPPSAPVFVSSPETTTLHMRQPFVYAPVVHATPRPTFRLIEAPQGATIDPVLGVVRWTASDLVARFTIEAENSVGKTEQSWVLATNDVVMTEWEIASSAPMNTAVNHVFLAADQSLWLARDTAWISRSTDAGRSWEHLRLPDTEVSVISVFAFDKNTAFVGTGGPQSLMNTGSGHIWKTTDGGLSWSDQLYGIDSRFANIHFWDAQNGIAASQGANDSADVFLTSNGGATWTRSTRVLARVPMYNTIAFADRNLGWFGTSDYYIRGDAGLLRTTDGGPQLGAEELRSRNDLCVRYRLSRQPVRLGNR